MPERQAAADPQALLRRLGMDDRGLHRITTWANYGEDGCVYVPPLPAEVVRRLVDLVSSEADSRVYCLWHHGWVGEGDAVHMGATEGTSGPGTARYACVPCVREKGLVPPSAGFVGHPSTPPRLAGGAA
jgi:hypothetical protein